MCDDNRNNPRKRNKGPLLYTINGTIHASNHNPLIPEARGPVVIPAFLYSLVLCIVHPWNSATRASRTNPHSLSCEPIRRSISMK